MFLLTELSNSSTIINSVQIQFEFIVENDPDPLCYSPILSSIASLQRGCEGWWLRLETYIMDTTIQNEY